MYKYTGVRWRGNRGTFFLFPFLCFKREQKERPPVSSGKAIGGRGGGRYGRRESAAEHGCELALYPWR